MYSLVIITLILLLILLSIHRVHVFSTKLANLGPSFSGKQYSAFNYLKDSLRCFGNAKDTIASGYSRLSGLATPFVVPTILNGPTMVLPASLAEELWSAPDAVLNFRQAVIIDGLRADYLFPGVADNPFHASVFRRHLANSSVLPQFPSILAEASSAVSAFLSKDENLVTQDSWTMVNIYNLTTMVLTQITAMVFVGTPLCRNQQFIRDLLRYFAAVRVTAGLLNLMPPSLRWLISKPVLIPLRWHRAAVARTLTPVILSRKQRMQTANPVTAREHQRDILDWILITAKDISAAEFNTERVIDRLLLGAFVAVHTTSITLYAAMYQLAHTPQIADLIRPESCDLLRAVPAGTTRSGASSTHFAKLDSFIYECMRYGNQNLLVLRRAVSARGGYRFADGTWVPQGSVVALPGYEIHHDAVYYDDANSFNPLRWTGKSVPTDDYFLAFGHGRHICPGRFLAMSELKCIIASMVAGYDICQNADKPMSPGGWIGENVQLDENAVLWMRMREI